MKLLIISCIGYPSYEDLYNSGFVHTRALSYLRAGFEVTVFVPKYRLKEDYEYTFEGINVLVGNKQYLETTIQDSQPDRLLVHFIDVQVIKILLNAKLNIPTIVWVHGYEALSWYRVLFEYKSLKQFAYFTAVNIRQLLCFRALAKKSNEKKIFFVFVSKWMYNITSSDIFYKINKYKIIPNPINHNLFLYSPKEEYHRSKILLIRSFGSRKYANDLAIEAILKLSKETFFNDLNFTIVGKGLYFEKLTRKLKSFSNVILLEKFLTQNEIAELHQSHGVLLCPTRMDAQGVSMCEGMMSGLVPITSNNTAIPEFVEDNTTGFLTENEDDIASKISFLFKNPTKFMEMSYRAHIQIKAIAGLKKVFKEEIEVITNLR